MTRVRRHGLLLLGAFVLAPVASSQAAPGQDPGTLPEYTVKAGFLFNFAKYVEWPSDAFEKADTPISIGIIGADPFGEELDRALKNKTVKERGFVIRRYREIGEVQPCHILFIPRTEMARLADILRKADPWPVLTVGEEEGFAKGGGVVNILIDKDKPRLEVNAEAAERARLVINSKLLKVATIVRTAK